MFENAENRPVNCFHARVQHTFVVSRLDHTLRPGHIVPTGKENGPFVLRIDELDDGVHEPLDVGAVHEILRKLLGIKPLLKRVNLTVWDNMKETKVIMFAHVTVDGIRVNGKKCTYVPDLGMTFRCNRVHIVEGMLPGFRFGPTRILAALVFGAAYQAYVSDLVP